MSVARSFEVRGTETADGRWKLEGGDALPVYTSNPCASIGPLVAYLVRDPVPLIISGSEFRQLKAGGAARHFVIGTDDPLEFPPLGIIGSVHKVVPSQWSLDEQIAARVSACRKESLDLQVIDKELVADWEERYGPGSLRPRTIWSYWFEKV